MRLCLRVGDGGSYEMFGDDFDAAVDHLGEMGVRSKLEESPGYGLVCDEFEGPCNYISAYWAEPNSIEKCQELGDDDIAELNNKLMWWIARHAPEFIVS
jgi:hypothetical protein